MLKYGQTNKFSDFFKAIKFRNILIISFMVKSLFVKRNSIICKDKPIIKISLSAKMSSFILSASLRGNTESNKKITKRCQVLQFPSS